ncbi:MAG: propanediol utilization protein [Chloroflexota bacterium]
MDVALALIEFDSIAVGMQAGDAMAKRAPLTTIRAGTVQPGKYLVLISGDVASVEESLAAGRQVGGEAVVDTVFLPQVHPAVVAAIGGGRTVGPGVALGIIETATVAAAIHAADAGVKGAQVTLLEVRLADGLGGKGLTLFMGEVTDVEAALDIGVGVLASPRRLVRQVIIPQLHADMAANITAATRFSERVTGLKPMEE